MAFPEYERLSPNRSGAVHERRGVVLHHSQKGFQDTIDYMLDPASRVSYHCLIDADGTRCTLVPDSQIAWHAGVSTFAGRANCNDFMLGLAFAGDSYSHPLTPAQLASAVEWLADRWVLFAWRPEWITDHRQVAPGRKADLNPVEWLRVAAAIRARFAPGAAPGSFPS
jgi:N-acetyl-anhydromuramoyl-L-alanine amidase